MFEFFNLSSEKLLINILLPIFLATVSASVPLWVLRRNLENANQSAPPALKRLEISANLYSQATGEEIFSKRVRQLKDNYETAADAALWESEVLKETSYQSYKQKSLLGVPYVTFMKQEITHMHPFNAPILLGLGIGFMKFLMYMLAIGTCLLCFTIQTGELELVFRMMFLLTSVVFLVLIQFFQSQKIVDCQLIQSQDEYVRILRETFGRKVNIKDNDFFRRRRLDAAVLSVEMREKCNLSLFQADSTSKSLSAVVRTVGLAMVITVVKMLAFLGIDKPLKKLAGNSPYESVS